MNQSGPPEKRPLSFYDSPVMNQKSTLASEAPVPQKITATSQTTTKKVPVSSPSSAFTVQYFTNSDAKIIKKVEHSPSGQTV